MAVERHRTVVTGVGGRMGAAIVAAVRASSDLVLSGVTERPGSDWIGRMVDAMPSAEAIAHPPDAANATRKLLHKALVVSESLSQAAQHAEVVIDFTTPDATLEHARLCADRGIPIVIGTTGFQAAQRDLAALASQTPIVLAPNMSVGVNVLFRLAAEVASVLGTDYDVEIVEAHHRMKKDAPSGTALRLAEIVAESLKLDASKDIVRTRDGNIGPRPHQTIGVQTVRGGDTVGEHTVFYFGEGERLELTHRATSRNNFAQGAVRAARWLVTQPPGLYDMQDVLGFNRGAAS